VDECKPLPRGPARGRESAARRTPGNGVAPASLETGGAGGGGFERRERRRDVAVGAAAQGGAAHASGAALVVQPDTGHAYHVIRTT